METTYQGYIIKFDEAKEKFICDIGENGESNIISAEKISTIKNSIDKMEEAPKQKSQDAIEFINWGEDLEVREVKVGAFGLLNLSRLSAWVTSKDGRHTVRRRYREYDLGKVRVVPEESKNEVNFLIEEIKSEKESFQKIKDAHLKKLEDNKRKIEILSAQVKPTIKEEDLPQWEN
jgi:hypothetical protein